jgi:hypothetical protein
VSPWVYVAVGVYAVVATPVAPWSTQAEWVTGGAITAVFTYAAVLRRHRRSSPVDAGPTPRSRVVGYLVWAVLFAAFATYQMAIFLTTTDRTVHPTLSALLNIAMGPRALQLVAFASWILFGLFLVRRVPGGPDGRTAPPPARLVPVLRDGATHRPAAVRR